MFQLMYKTKSLGRILQARPKDMLKNKSLIMTAFIVVAFTVAGPTFLMSSAAPAKASPIQQFSQTKGVGAQAAWPALGLFITKDKSGTNILVNTADGLVGETSTAANVFQTTPNLATATLSPVTVHVTCIISICILPPKDLIIEAAWTASGPPVTTISGLHFHPPEFGKGVVVVFSGTQTAVPATATGISNGQNLGQSDPSLGGADIFKFTSLSISVCSPSVCK